MKESLVEQLPIGSPNSSSVDTKLPIILVQYSVSGVRSPFSQHKPISLILVMLTESFKY